ncbi:MAG: hypothetical protein CL610_13945 [Anaerolineaceae bacterium]|nr:hypothetical protein [Anaerolineaceae bacterium]
MAENVYVERTVPATGRHEVVSEVQNVALPYARRISWGAIIAGIVIALVTQIMLNMLGFSVGINTINPATEANPIEPALGTGLVIWLAASTLLSMFAGGFVAGHLANMPDSNDGLLHGLLTWGVVSLITLVLLTSTGTSVIGGATRLIGQGVSLAGQTIADVAPQAADALGLQDLTLQQIRQEAVALAQQTDEAALQPGAVEEQADAAGNVVESTTNDIVQNPTTAQREIDAAMNRLMSLSAIEEADRDAVVSVLTERTNLTEEEARQTLNEWEQSITQVRADAEEAVRQATQNVTDAIAAIMGAIFAAMVVGAFAAGAGGLIGSPNNPITND